MSPVEPLQDSVNSLFTLFVFVPINLIALAVIWGILALINRLLRLRFSAITIALAAGLLVFAFVFSWLDEVDSNNGWVSFRQSPTGLYAFTAILAGFNVVIAALFTLVLRLFKKKPLPSEAPPLPVPPLPKKRRLIAASVWLLLFLGFGLGPFVRATKIAFEERRHADMLANLSSIIENGDLASFEKALADNPNLWETKLAEHPQESLFDVLIERDKVPFVALLMQRDPKLVEYAFDWKLSSNAMADALIANGLDVDKALMEAIENDQEEVARYIVQKHRPPFRGRVDLMTMILMRDGKTDLLHYLAKNGLSKNQQAANEALVNRAYKNDFEGMKKLTELGFKVDPTVNVLPYWAVYHGNLPMLKFLMQHPFDVNGKSDEYTHLENAIAGNKNDIFDYLLTLNPDVTTLHITKLNGETNALQMAERYKRKEMLEKLQRYTATRP